VQDAALLQTILEGVPLPADRARLIEYAREQHAPADLTARLERIPDREYATLDEVGEELAPVQPSRPESGPQVPEAESGKPPGREAYTDASAGDTGAVRTD
jgi:hypothetical protein